MKKAFLLSLGCPRNLTDSEVLIGILERSGIEMTDDAEGADIGIVNTCGFIEDAKNESIEAILQMVELKKEKKLKRLVVTGCLSQRYPDELMKDINEIDGLFGTSDFTEIPGMIDMLDSERVKRVSGTPEYLYDHGDKRRFLTPGHSIYVKIQEGCSNRCSYCVIPNLKGARRSRTVESVISEIKDIKESTDVKEIVLIGQDTTSFGLDNYGSHKLPELLSKVSPLVADGWIRLLYTHPAHITEGLLDVISSNGNICRYLDIPIQHASDRVLEAMNRKVSQARIREIIRGVREKIDDVVLRTSVIIGFPGETDEEFRELMGFLEEIRFEKLGAFIYSREEGTPAAEMEGQVPGDIKEARFDEIMRLQQGISYENNLKMMGREIKVLVEEQDPASDGRFLARSEMDAPEVDGLVYVNGKDLKTGDFAMARITGTLEYDLIGDAV